MTRRAPKPREALCPECDWFIRVKRDGRLYMHKREDARTSEFGKERFDELCPGSGDLPAELDERETEPGSELFDADPAREADRDPRVVLHVRSMNAGVRSRWT